MSFPEQRPGSMQHDQRVLAKIRGVDLVESQVGRWPDFHDFEIVSITLDRSSHADAISSDLRAVFYIFDTKQVPASPERNPGHAEILFHDIDELSIEGFNHQNPIMGLGLQLVHCVRLGADRLAVEWGGTCLHHEVRFRCDRITVVRVTDLDPFRRGGGG